MRASGARRRPKREVRAAPVEAPTPGRLWRGLARAARVGPLAGGAALALAGAVAAHGPGSDGDRLVGADLATPLAWAAGGVWATTVPRIGRVAVLVAIAAVAALAVALS